jgi:Fe-S-cluster containining protein
MSSETTAPEMVTATVRLAGEDWKLEAQLTVPTAPIRLRQALPLVQAFADRVVDAGVQSAEARGEHISCKKGCGACCRQPVPIAEVEARDLRRVVEEMPEPRRSEVRARFAAARQRLVESGMLERLERRGQWNDGEGRQVGLDYFSLGIACPFLEEESCSIHPQRPVACREYLVTSPAEECAHPSPERVRMVKMPMKVWTALARFDPVPAGESMIRWVPLILALDWAEAHPAEPAPRPGPELLRQLFDHLTKNRGPEQAPTTVAEGA